MRPSIVISVLACCLLSIPAMGPAGCASAEPAEEPPLALPLEHDPTDEITLARWWSDGRRLLLLEPTGRYALYDEPNRFRPPAEVGRWSQPSYAVVWLEPYRQLETTRVRVGIDRLDDGRLALTVPGGPPLRPIDEPPAVLEDRLVGPWSSDVARLLLRADGQYWLEPVRTGARLVSSAGHGGRWSVDDETLVLEPNGGIDPVRMLRIDVPEQDDEPLALVADDATFTAERPPPRRP